MKIVQAGRNLLVCSCICSFHAFNINVSDGSCFCVVCSSVNYCPEIHNDCLCAYGRLCSMHVYFDVKQAETDPGPRRLTHHWIRQATVKRTFYPDLLPTSLLFLDFFSPTIPRIADLSAIANACSMISIEQGVEECDVDDIDRALCDDDRDG